MNADEINFMSRVVPWPKDDAPGYINVHWHLPGGPFKGHAVRTFDAFQAEVEELRDRESNLYFCLSQQREAKPNGSSHLLAVRNRLNAKALKSIWFDIDVKPNDPKAYSSSKEALEALKDFLAKSGLPAPSAVVSSGSGGSHVYWFSKTPLIPGLWQQHADGLRALAEQHGLKIDAGCTTDAARVLRVPGTLNYKHTPPTDVVLLEMGDEYDFSAALSAVLVSAETASRGFTSRRPLPKVPARFADRKDAIVVKDEQLPLTQPPRIVDPFPVLRDNRTCRFPASGSRTRLHAFPHGTSCPSRHRRTSRKCP